MEIKDLMTLVDQMVIRETARIDNLIREMKEVKRAADEKTKELQMAMANLAHELKPIESAIKSHSPHLSKLFDSAIVLYEETKYSDRHI